MGRVSRSDILTELQGQTLEIKGLRSLFSAWPSHTNLHVEEVRQDVVEMLTSYFPKHPKLQKLLQGDYGLFGATWWPNASLDRLKVATYLSIWLFIWDDEIDSDIGSLSEDFEKAQKYRAETMAYVQYSLGLRNLDRAALTNNQIIRSFDLVGIALKKCCTPGQCADFAKELAFFLEKSELEQRLRLTGKMLTLSEFYQFRLGTSAVRVVLAVNEYCNETELPLSVLEDPDFRALNDLTNANICNVNDLLSVKKEIAQGAAESLLPIIYSEVRSVPLAIKLILESIAHSIEELDKVSVRLLRRFEGDQHVSIALRKYIRGCKHYCTGNLEWSLRTGRYGVHQDVNGDHLLIRLEDCKA